MVAFNEVYFEKYFLKIKKNQIFALSNEIKDPRSLIDLSAIEEKNNIKIYIINERYLNDVDISLSREDIKTFLPIRKNLYSGLMIHLFHLIKS